MRGGNSETIYFGSRQSESFLRIYNKQAEQVDKGEEDPGHWIRVELELKGDRSHLVALRYLEDGVTAIIGLIRNQIDFKQISSDINPSRWPTAPWWGAFLDWADKTKLCAPREKPTIDRTKKWLFNQVAPSLAFTVEYEGGIMVLQEAIEVFLQAKQAEGVSSATLVWYKQHLKRLVHFLGEVSIDDIRPIDLRRFALSLNAHTKVYTDHPYHEEHSGSLSPATQQGILRAMCHFFRWLMAEGCLEVDPTLRLKLPPIPKQPPKGIAPDDLRALLHATEGDDPALKRDRALLLFLADTGCRVAGA
jgi:hypothetical protein